MISSIGSTQTAPIAPAASSRAQAPQKTPDQNPQDTVQLSPAARGGGDVDHDGDSH